MADVVIAPGTARVSLFQKVAIDFFDCCESYKPTCFSVVPYFLCCMSIELALKTLHVESGLGRNEVKRFGHKLVQSYNALPAKFKILSADDLQVLEQANAVYIDEKGFEYIHVMDFVTNGERFPDLASLRAIARRFVDTLRYRQN